MIQQTFKPAFSPGFPNTKITGISSDDANFVNCSNPKILVFHRKKKPLQYLRIADFHARNRCAVLRQMNKGIMARKV